MNWPRRLLRLCRQGKRELAFVGAAFGLLVGALVFFPIRARLLWLDTHRPVSYIKYEADSVHPIGALAIAAKNMENWLHETWNRASYSRKSARWVADEFESFIARNDYNQRFVANDAGSDWSRPWLRLVRDSLPPAQAQYDLVVPPMRNIHAAHDGMSRAWSHSSVNHYRTETYQCGTPDKPRTCTRQVCTSTDHYFTLNRELMQASAEVGISGLEAWPVVAPSLFSGAGSWQMGPLNGGWNSLLADAESAKRARVLEAVRDGVPSWPANFYNRNGSCGPPTQYPNGWRTRDAARASTGAMIEHSAMVQRSLKAITELPVSVEGEVLRIANGTQTEAALKRLSNLAWDFHDAVDSEGSRRMGTRTIWLTLASIVLAGLCGVGSWALLDKFAHVQWVKRIWEGQ